jgi:tetratricopeptide (TPR) repeat protein
MNRPAWALAVLGVVCVLAVPALAVHAAPLSVSPTLLTQNEGGVVEDLTKAQRYYLRGVELMGNLKYLDAVEAFQLAIDEDAKYVDAYRRMALAYAEMAKSDPEYYQDALDTYMDLEKLLPPDDVEVRKNVAYVQAAMGDMDDAIATYQEILTITPQDCSMWTQVGDAQRVMADRMKTEKGDQSLEHKARMDEAIKAYSKVIELCPDNLVVHNTLGEIYYGLGRREEAAQVYEKMIVNDPKNVDVASRLAFIYYKAENWPKAAEAYKRLLDIDPERLDDRAIYAQVLQKLGKAQEAADQLLKVIESDPSKNTLLCNLGFLYLEGKNYEKAIEIAKRGIAGNAPVTGCLYVIWGQGLEYKGDALLREYNYDRSISTYGDAKLKLQTAVSDANFGEYARKRMARLDQLIEIAKQTKAKASQGGAK